MTSAWFFGSAMPADYPGGEPSHVPSGRLADGDAGYDDRMNGRENDVEQHDQDSEPSLNAPGDAGPTGIGEDTDEDAEDEA